MFNVYCLFILKWKIHGKLCRTIGPLSVLSQEMWKLGSPDGNMVYNKLMLLVTKDAGSKYPKTQLRTSSVLAPGVLGYWSYLCVCVSYIGGDNKAKVFIHYFLDSIDLYRDKNV